MKRKQAAVDWLEDELAKNLKHIVLNRDHVLMQNLFVEATARMKKQIETAYEQGLLDCLQERIRPGSMYYEENYGSNDESK